jgi:hypothetical protein
MKTSHHRWKTAAALLILLAASPSASPAATNGFHFAAVNDKSLGLWEGARPVLVYNHGVLSKTGVPADRNRSSYIHPIHGLDGEVLTDDFPRDHYHHRGLFWAWPHVKIDGREYDLWAIKGIEQRFERWLEQKASSTEAVLGVENGWFVGPKKVMQERVWFRVSAATTNGQALDCDFTWTPISQPVSLAGAEGKVTAVSRCGSLRARTPSSPRRRATRRKTCP